MVREGEAGDAMYILQDGACAATILGPLAMLKARQFSSVLVSYSVLLEETRRLGLGGLLV